MLNNFSLLFDLDGTLCDTDLQHFNAFVALLKEFGRLITLADYQSRIMGQPNVAIMRDFFPEVPSKSTGIMPIARK
jgi:beta-phosphoglucomutase